MKPAFHARLLNSSFEDPCLFVNIPHEKRALLFDLGTIHALAPGDLYKISDVFVTHTHMDHFIGFDTLLRGILRRDTPLNLYGPVGIVSCVEAKLKGYAWNLIEGYPTEIQVFEYTGRQVNHARFAAKNRFRKQLIARFRSDGLLLRDRLFLIRSAKLDHGIPCLAYSLEEEFHINIDKALLTQKGLTVGPWLHEFKNLIRTGEADRESSIRIGRKRYRISRLIDIARITSGQKISYATDVALQQENIDTLTRLIKGSDLFFCEAYFLDADREKALERFHLTAMAAGRLAREAAVKKIELMHFSPKYRDCPGKLIEEAMQAFSG